MWTQLNMKFFGPGKWLQWSKCLLQQIVYKYLYCIKFLQGYFIICHQRASALKASAGDDWWLRLEGCWLGGVGEVESKETCSRDVCVLGGGVAASDQGVAVLLNRWDNLIRAERKTQTAGNCKWACEAGCVTVVWKIILMHKQRNWPFN